MKAKQITRGIFAMLIAITLSIVSVMSVLAYDVSEEIRSGNYDYYILSDGTIRLSAYYGADENLEIPETIDGYEVSAIGRAGGALWFFNNLDPNGNDFRKTKSIKLPKTLSWFCNDVRDAFGNWRTIENIYVDDENIVFKSENGVLYNSDMTELLFYPEGKKDTIFKVPDSVNIIKDGFTWNNYLKEIYLNTNITEIYEYSFSDCPNVTLYVYPDSYALEWAQNHDFEYVIVEEEQPIEKELVDTQTGIKVNGVMDSEATLKVESIENTVENSVATFNITLEKDENIIQPSGEITISIPCEYEDCTIYWIKVDGTKEEMVSEYIEGCYEFTTDHLSVYTLVVNQESTETVPTETIPETTNCVATEPLTQTPTNTNPDITETEAISNISTPDNANNGDDSNDNGTVKTGSTSIAVIILFTFVSLTTGVFAWQRRKEK